MWFLYISDLQISTAENHIGITRNKHLDLKKRQYIQHYWTNKGFKGTVVNLALPSLHGGSLEITLKWQNFNLSLSNVPVIAAPSKSGPSEDLSPILNLYNLSLYSKLHSLHCIHDWIPCIVHTVHSSETYRWDHKSNTMRTLRANKQKNVKILKGISIDLEFPILPIKKKRNLFLQEKTSSS